MIWLLLNTLSYPKLIQIEEKEKTALIVFISQFVLGLSPPDLPANLVSGGKILERPLSTGKQDYETNKSVWPLNKPVPKLEAATQCSGECLKYSVRPVEPQSTGISWKLRGIF